MLASEYIAELQELVDTYGDRELWTATDDEGNSYTQPYSPQIGYVDNRYVEQHVLDGAELTTYEEEIAEAWAESAESEELEAIADSMGREPGDVTPSKEVLKEYIDMNYTLVFVS